MHLQTLRIVDANCNRISEGLRFLEDTARFLIDDVDLSQQLRKMRHDRVKSLAKFGVALLSERNSESDVGINIDLVSQQQDLPSLVTANSRRVEEALRVIEEIAKLPEISPTLDSNEFKQARFDLYTLERKLSSKILRLDKMARFTGLYVIIDTQALGTRDAVDTASKAIRGGAKVIQLRDKHHDKGEILTLAQKLNVLCYKSEAIFIMNDNLDIALACDADGLHIGQTDLPISVARKELPIDKIIGCSTITPDQALKAETEGADYIAAGSIFPTPTKEDTVVIGIEGLRQIKQVISTPLVAIGGINKGNIVEVMAAGTDSAAVISAIINQEDIERATRELVAQIEQKT